MTPRDQLFDRTTARRALNLPDDAILCLVQLGSEANFDMSLPRARLLEFLDRHQQVIAVDVRSPLHFEEHADFHERLVMRKVYPLGQYLKAFDFAVCAAGYNTFHENIAAALPSIFIPNSNPIMDVQEARAEYGARAGGTSPHPPRIHTQSETSLCRCSIPISANRWLGRASESPTGGTVRSRLRISCRRSLSFPQILWRSVEPCLSNAAFARSDFGLPSAASGNLKPTPSTAPPFCRNTAGKEQSRLSGRSMRQTITCPTR